MKTTKLFFMAALALTFAACSNDDNDLTTQQPQKAEGITITATLAPKTNGTDTRAISDQSTYIKAEWAENEHIAILYTVGSEKKVADATITGVTDGVATIEFTVDGSTTDGTDCTLVYPLSAAKADHSGVQAYASLLAAQDGTLSANLDVRVGAGTIQTSTPSLNVTTQPAAQFSIIKFTLTGTSIDGTHPLVIKDGSENVITTVTPASTATSVYVAMPAAASSTYKFIVTTADNKYIKSGTATITVGKYYQTTLAMTARYPLAMANATVEDLGSVIANDGNIYLNAASATAASKTASGIIAYVGSEGSVDESSSTYKGLAIALTDANSGSDFQWYGYNSGSCVSESNNIATARGYKNGIACTETLVNSNSLGVTTLCAGHNHAAAKAAKNFSTDRPSGVSPWFLPSIGQWNLIVQGLATKKSGFTVSTNLSYQGKNSTYAASNLNSVITDAGGTGFQEKYYWSSTMYSESSAWCMRCNWGDAAESGKSGNHPVRAVFAF